MTGSAPECDASLPVLKERYKVLYIFGIYWDNGKEDGKYCIIIGYIFGREHIFHSIIGEYSRYLLAPN